MELTCFLRDRRTAGVTCCRAGLKINVEADGEVERSLTVRTVAIYACADAGFILPSKNATKASQLKKVSESEQGEAMAAMFRAVALNSEMLYHVL